MKRKVYLFLTTLFTSFVYLLTLPLTMSKFTANIYNVAWENIFTKFIPIGEVIEITSNTGLKTEEVWGAKTTHTSSFNKVGVVDEVTSTNYNLYYATNEIYSAGIGGNTISASTIENTFSDSMINKLKNYEVNIMNQTAYNMVLSVEIYYYAPKLHNENDVHLTFGIYNTKKASGFNKGVKCEFVVNTGSENYTKGKYQGIVEVPAYRTSGKTNGEVIVTSGFLGLNRTTYYAHGAIINPYSILYDSGSRKILTGHYADWENGTGNKENPVTYRYPAQDNQTSINNTAFELLPDTNINDFIIAPGAIESYNLSVYYGNFVDEETNYSFFTALKFSTYLESDIQKDINYNLTKYGY